jgi:halogenation protein CepH
MPAPRQGNILAVAFGSGWFWYIPLSDELTSVGAVLLPEALDRVQGDRERALRELIAECPMIADFLADATRVTTGPYGQIRVRKDYSYLQEKFWRPGLVLAGDAACFIDPVFSSGVHLATYGALLAARSVNTALGAAADLDEATLFDEFEVRYRQEYARFHDFLVAFYDMHSDEQSYFWKAKKVTGSSGSEQQSFVDLVGGGSSDEPALIDAGAYLDRRDRDIDELAWSVAQAGAQIQVQAATGGVVDEQVPVRPGGLLPSADGMHWSLPSPASA